MELLHTFINDSIMATFMAMETATLSLLLYTMMHSMLAK